MSGDVVERARAAVARIDALQADGPICVDCQDMWAGVDEELVSELVAEVERLRAQLAAVPSAIESYAASELDPLSYELGDPELTEDDRRVLLAERELLYKLQRNAEQIVDYAATRRQS